jgi:hypothetical protein
MIVHMDGMQEPFKFPKNLKDLSAKEREELHFRWLAHNATGPSSDLTPSKVIDVHSPDYLAKIAEMKKADELKKAEIQESLVEENDLVKNASEFEFIEGFGYVVPAEESLQQLAGRLSPEAYDDLKKKIDKKKPKLKVEPKDPDLGPPEGESGDRFDNLWI